MVAVTLGITYTEEETERESDIECKTERERGDVKKQKECATMVLTES